MTRVAERSRPVFEATLYLDKDGDASVRSRHLGYFPSLRLATDAVNEVRDKGDQPDGWFTGGVTYGFLYPPVFGRRPERFEEDDRELSWYVGTDGKAVR